MAKIPKLGKCSRLLETYHEIKYIHLEFCFRVHYIEDEPAQAEEDKPAEPAAEDEVHLLIVFLKGC